MSAAAILTASAVLFTAIVTGALAVIREIRGVHAIVNQQRTDMLDEIRDLKRSVRALGGDPDQSE